MKLFFWNLNNNDNSALITAALKDNDVDVAAFAEHRAVDFGELCNCLNDRYRVVEAVDGSGKTILLLKRCISSKGVFSQGRYLLATIQLDAQRRYNIVSVHFSDQRNDPHGANRLNEAQSLVASLRQQEEEQGCRSNVIIGDFNASPFDDALVWATGLNATLYRGVATRLRTKVNEGNEYPLMYNPTIEFLSEKENNCGSFYLASGATTLYWYCLDQVIVSADLADAIEDVRYLRHIGDRSLLADIAPDKRVSDHLPLLVTIGSEVADG